MKSKTCKTCKYWDDTKYHPVKSKIKVGECSNDKITENWGGTYEGDELIYPYSEGGYFMTGPNFGCVHHKEK